ncbi:sensor histidine kinase [Plebeiibacterium marinum]|uniref:histidine kinase n=1 Tax=Plebeiibacterium marinum TaxID=2992111 RepID=A0AAE3MAG8_9BACT|nr:HAMP domain-containing sensor histidine kinase [Plebeiobacterium marinum]MCW3804049.1 HAMP domain-containing histidine kinase [Plebeiobacterium marinum]
MKVSFSHPLFLFLLFWSFIELKASNNQRNVLVINSYHMGYSWTDEVVEGIRSKLDSAGNINYFLEFMDTKRFLDETTFINFHNYLTTKYQTVNFDVIVVSDNNAMDFYLTYRDSSLFRNKPFVFSGLANVDNYPVEKLGAYGVAELRGLPLIFYTMHRFFPDRDTITVYLDSTVTSKTYAELTRTYQEEHEEPVFNLVYDVPSDSIKYHLSTLSDNNMVFLFNLNYFSKRGYIPFEEYLRLLGDSCNIPIFSSQFKNIKGIVGGEKNMGREHGEVAAQLVIKILNGEFIDQRIIYPTPKLYFNDIELRKFGIKEPLLPRNSTIVNTKKSWIVLYGKLFFVNSMIVLAVVLIIIALIVSNRKLKRFKLILEEARDKAIQSESVKTALIANISHELRTPLNSIIGFSDILAAEFENKDNAEAEYIRCISDSSKILESLVNELLDLSLIDSNEVKLNYSEVNIPEFLESLAQQNTIQIDHQRKPKLGIRVSNYENEPQIIYTDKMRLNQILQNLVSNAIKYSFSGTITIGYHLITKNEVAEKLGDDSNLSHDYYFLFFVKDYGIGIPQELRSFVFERFRRIDQLYDGQHGGVGLGLSISKSLVQIMGGDMWFKSVEKKGSTFYFVIPHVNRV